MATGKGTGKRGNEKFKFTNSLRYRSQDLSTAEMMETSRELRLLSQILRNDAQRLRNETRNLRS